MQMLHLLAVIPSRHQPLLIIHSDDVHFGGVHYAIRSHDQLWYCGQGEFSIHHPCDNAIGIIIHEWHIQAVMVITLRMYYQDEVSRICTPCMYLCIQWYMYFPPILSNIRRVGIFIIWSPNQLCWKHHRAEIMKKRSSIYRGSAMPCKTRWMRWRQLQQLPVFRLSKFAMHLNWNILLHFVHNFNSFYVTEHSAGFMRCIHGQSICRQNSIQL